MENGKKVESNKGDVICEAGYWDRDVRWNRVEAGTRTMRRQAGENCVLSSLSLWELQIQLSMTHGRDAEQETHYNRRATPTLDSPSGCLARIRLSTNSLRNSFAYLVQVFRLPVPLPFRGPRFTYLSHYSPGVALIYPTPSTISCAHLAPLQSSRLPPCLLCRSEYQRPQRIAISALTVSQNLITTRIGLNDLSCLGLLPLLEPTPPTLQTMSRRCPHRSSRHPAILQQL
jgi:hypothetical protein